MRSVPTAGSLLKKGRPKLKDTAEEKPTINFGHLGLATITLAMIGSGLLHGESLLAIAEAVAANARPSLFRTHPCCRHPNLHYCLTLLDFPYLLLHPMTRVLKSLNRLMRNDYLPMSNRIP